MPEKYLNKYRNASARAAWWDYALDAAYFITICTEGRRWYFGEVTQGRMQPSPIGTMAHTCWHEIKHHALNVDLGDFVVMPNHVHGILILNGNNDFVANTTFKSNSWQLHPRFRDQGRNTVSSIIGSYKSAVSKHAHRMGYSFAWQSRFHDHIIRNVDEYKRISTYIRNNPRNWPFDKFHRTS